MGEDNLGLSKLTVVCRALHLFITVSHFYSWHLNVGESGDWRRGTDSRRENAKGEFKLWITSGLTWREASKNRVGNRCMGLCGCVHKPCVSLREWLILSVCVCVYTPYLYSSQHSPAPPRLQIPPQEPRGSWFCPWRQRADWEAVAACHLQGETETLGNPRRSSVQSQYYHIFNLKIAEIGDQKNKKTLCRINMFCFLSC